jgi:uncharacterized membrane protein
MTAWLIVLLVGACTVAIKAAGPAALGGRQLPSRVLGLVEALAPALLAALVATATFASGSALAFDARALGLAAAAIALALRAPVLAVLVIAAATTAIARLIW